MSHTQILLVGTAIVFILFGIQMVYSHQKGKPLIALQSDELTLEESNAMERGDIQIEKVNQNYRWWLFFAILVINTTNIIFGGIIGNCELVWGLEGYFWQIIIWFSISTIAIFAYIFDSIMRYKKALQTGFMPRLKQRSRIYLVSIKSSSSQIHQVFFAKFATTIAVLLVLFMVSNQIISSKLKNLGLDNLPTTSLSTYHIASQKLQQQCSAKKEK